MLKSKRQEAPEKKLKRKRPEDMSKDVESKVCTALSIDIDNLRRIIVCTFPKNYVVKLFTG